MKIENYYNMRDWLDMKVSRGCSDISLHSPAMIWMYILTQYITDLSMMDLCWTNVWCQITD
jgi:hypothetical protein